MKSPEESSTEAIYFSAYHCYLLQKPDFKLYFELLLDHYAKYPKSFSCLTKNDVLRIKKMQDDFKSNKYSLFSGQIDFNNSIPEALKREKADQKHSHLCLNIIKEKTFIESFIGPVSFLSLEHPTLYGPIDILAQSEDTAYVVEVKTKAADHSIIGQVMKYFIGISLKLNYRFYDDVKIITLCPGYDKPSYAGLKQIGATPYVIKSNPLKILKLTF